MEKRKTLLKVAQGEHYALITYADEIFFCYFVHAKNGIEEVVDFEAEETAFNAAFFLKFYMDVMDGRNDRKNLYFSGVNSASFAQELNAITELLLEQKKGV